MASAAALKSRLDSVLRRFGPSLQTAYLRKLTITGDQLIGRTTTTSLDTLFDPQPITSEVTEEMVLSNGAVTQIGDLKFTFSASALTLANLQDQTAQIVLKDSNGVQSVFKLLHYKPAQIGGTAVSFTVYARSVSR